MMIAAKRAEAAADDPLLIVLPTFLQLIWLALVHSPFHSYQVSILLKPHRLCLRCIFFLNPDPRLSVDSQRHGSFGSTADLDDVRFHSFPCNHPKGFPCGWIDRNPIDQARTYHLRLT